ncbi:unnamed protein product [Diamesa serratosioi]
MKLVVFLIVVAICISSAGLALKCYNCDSQYNSDCSDDGYNKQMKECDELGTVEKFTKVEAMCLKEVTTVDGVKKTLRKCTRKAGSIHTCSVVLGMALRCYECNSENRSNCIDDGFNDQANECTEPTAVEKLLGINAVCLKAVYEGNDMTKAIRSCSRQGGSINACIVFTEIKHCSTCTADFCNNSHALHCYSCDSKTDVSCGEDGYRKESMKCLESNSTDKFNEQVPVCVKEVTNENGIMVTSRSCAAESRQFVVCSLVPGVGHCSTCEKDLCNSAVSKKINLMTSIVLILVAFVSKLI